MKAIRDSLIIFGRELRPVMRDPLSVLFTITQPLILLLLFGPLLAGFGAGAGAGMYGVAGSGSDSTWQWFVPGILVMIAIFGSGATGFNAMTEIQSGSWERILVTPVSRAALLVGQALKEMAPLTLQAVVIIAVAVPLGFTFHISGAIVGIVVLVVFGIGVGALSYALAVAVRDKDWLFWSVQQTLMFPLLILSGMMLPLDAAPRWMQIVASINPLTYLVDAQRAMFSGILNDPVVIQGAIAAVGTAVIGITIGIPVVQRAK